MVYTSDSLALAVLELLARLNDATFLPKFVVIPADLPEALVTEIGLAKLPVHWQSHSAPPELQRLGDAWVKASSSLALRVPSAVIPRQHNYLLNPEHPDFGALKISPPEPFVFDMPRVAMPKGGTP